MFINESPKFLFSSQRTEAACHALTAIRGTGITVTFDHLKDKIYSQLSLTKDTDSCNYFRGSNLKPGLIMVYLTSFCALTQINVIFFLPKILGEDSKSLDSVDEKSYSSLMVSLIISALFEVPTNIVSGILPNMEVFKRKGSMALGVLVVLLSCGMCLLNSELIFLSFTLIKAFTNLTFTVANLYTAEIFNTDLRTTAVGLNFCVSRLAIIVSFPFFNFMFKEHERLAVGTILFGALVSIGLIAWLEEETFGRKMK